VNPEHLQVLLARCMGTLEAIVGTVKLPQETENKVFALLKDISNATGIEMPRYGK
jgi:hypothetical protein